MGPICQLQALSFDWTPVVSTPDTLHPFSLLPFPFCLQIIPCSLFLSAVFYFFLFYRSLVYPLFSLPPLPCTLPLPQLNTPTPLPALPPSLCTCSSPFKPPSPHASHTSPALWIISPLPLFPSVFSPRPSFSAPFHRFSQPWKGIRYRAILQTSDIALPRHTAAPPRSAQSQRFASSFNAPISFPSHSSRPLIPSPILCPSARQPNFLFLYTPSLFSHYLSICQ